MGKWEIPPITQEMIDAVNKEVEQEHKRIRGEQTMKDMNKIIKEIIDEFAKQEIVFSNEQDFQFQMAIALKTGNYGIEDVKLETISLEEDWSAVKNRVQGNKKLKRQTKQYHDILVKLPNDEYVLIELKYKTPSKLCFYETKLGETITFIQGAYFFGAYGFLEDIARLENISKRYMTNDMQKKIKKAYAVLLTNDKNYRYNDFGGRKKSAASSPWLNYSIKDGKKFDAGEIHFLINGKQESMYKTPNGKLFNSITLEHDYKPLEWHCYLLPGYNNYKDEREHGKSCTCPGFSYLIVEVEPI